MNELKLRPIEPVKGRQDQNLAHFPSYSFGHYPWILG